MSLVCYVCIIQVNDKRGTPHVIPKGLEMRWAPIFTARELSALLNYWDKKDGGLRKTDLV